MIHDAREYLGRIGDAIKIAEEIQKEVYANLNKNQEPDYEKMREVKTQIADLSSRFYELIPHF